MFNNIQAYWALSSRIRIYSNKIKSNIYLPLVRILSVYDANIEYAGLGFLFSA